MEAHDKQKTKLPAQLSDETDHLTQTTHPNLHASLEKRFPEFFECEMRNVELRIETPVPPNRRTAVFYSALRTLHSAFARLALCPSGLHTRLARVTKFGTPQAVRGKPMERFS